MGKGVPLHHIVTHFRITCTGSTASLSVHSKDISAWEAVSCCDNWSACVERKAQWGFFCKMESLSLWSRVWSLTLVTTCHPAVVTQVSVEKWGCVLWQKVDLLITRWCAAQRNPTNHHCNVIPSDRLPSSPYHWKTSMVMEKDVFPEHLGWCLQQDVLWALTAPVPSPQEEKPPFGGKWCIFKPETGQSTITAAGCRYQTRLLSGKKTRKPVNR